MSCCTPILHGWFERERLARIGLRHTSWCHTTPGLIEEIKKAQWWQKGAKVRTGEVYR